MKKEDIKFLLQLKEDMKNGDHVSQAFPRFWMILDYKYVLCPEGDEDKIEIYYDGEHYSFEEFKEYILDSFDLWDDDIKELNEIEDGDYDTLENFCDEHSIDANIAYMREESFLSYQTGAFLTREDAEAFLEVNSYNFNSKAHTYALTGWRNPRFERLMTILENIEECDFNA